MAALADGYSLVPESPFTFGYGDFLAWYEKLAQSRLRPGLLTFVRLLNQKLDDELVDFERQRIRVSSSRVKQPYRLWAKLVQDKHRTAITSLDSILTSIDDLVGVRVICNNLSDIARIQELLGSLPNADEAEIAPLALEAESERRYYLEPKLTGYRAYHINLVTIVPGSDCLHRVRGELQVRTLLQDGWGELTHEDTYKPGATLPPLATTLARRMADLLATVDDIAEDLRKELDRAVQDAVTGEDQDSSLVVPETTDVVPSLLHQAAPVVQPEEKDTFSTRDLLAEVYDIVQALTKPTSLASIAHRLQSKFGSDITRGWGGYATFKLLLRAAVPDIHIIYAGPGYVVPVGIAPQESLALGGEVEEGLTQGVPQLVLRLVSFDRKVPAIGQSGVEDLTSALAHSLSASTWDELGLLDSDRKNNIGIREVNTLSRTARDWSEAHGSAVSRGHLDYLLKSLLWSGNLRPGLPLDDAIDVIAHWMVVRAASNGIAADPEQDIAQIRRWLEGETLII